MNEIFVFQCENTGLDNSTLFLERKYFIFLLVYICRKQLQLFILGIWYMPVAYFNYLPKAL